MMMLVSLLRRFMGPALLTLLGVVAGWFVYHGIYQSGYSAAASEYQLRLSHQAETFDLAKAQAAEASNQALKSAVAHEREALTRAERLTDELAHRQRQLVVVQHLLKGKINDAVTHDGPRFTGLGPDSVQLYARALGYAGAGDRSVSDTAAGLALYPADAGLSPVALLGHASDYGAWCLSLRNQLVALEKFYQKVPAS
ncbi:hypothetical protein [Serratia marcescens]|uniref:Lysis protein n=1 Tax=Serratia marcescens TaxID=615 RepID=A0A9X8VL01_SERMA|nr:hypothetical protein [Serratia marcescens]MBS3893067.1 hypothetical protein [Serratia marcescens]